MSHVVVPSCQLGQKVHCFGPKDRSAVCTVPQFGPIKLAGGFWTCRSIYMERSAEHFECNTHFLPTFKRHLKHLLLVLPAHRARWTLLQLMRCTNYLLTYTSKEWMNVFLSTYDTKQNRHRVFTTCCHQSETRTLQQNSEERDFLRTAK